MCHMFDNVVSRLSSLVYKNQHGIRKKNSNASLVNASLVKFSAKHIKCCMMMRTFDPSAFTYLPKSK